MKQFDPETFTHTSTNTSTQYTYNQQMPARKKAAQTSRAKTFALRYAPDRLTEAREELLYDALDLTREASAFAELSQIFARRGLALIAEHALQKASGRLAYATALLDLADEVAGPAAPVILATAP